MRTLVCILAVATAIPFLVQAAEVNPVTESKPPPFEDGLAAYSRQIAEGVVKNSMRLKPGEVVLIRGAKFQMPLLEDIAAEATKIGARASLMITSDKIERARSYETSDEHFGNPGAHFTNWIGTSDVLLDVIPNLEAPPMEFFAELPEARRVVMNQVFAERSAALRHWGGRHMVLLLPRASSAPENPMEIENYAKLMWPVLAADYSRISQNAEEIAKLLCAAKEIRIRSTNGTDLTVKVEDRRLYLDTGVARSSGERTAKDDRIVFGRPNGSAFIPSGTVSFAPVRSSAQGKVFAQETICGEETVQGIRLEFQRGVAISHSASSGDECLGKSLSADGAASARVTALQIGLNRALNGSEKPFDGYSPERFSLGVSHIARWR